MSCKILGIGVPVAGIVSIHSELLAGTVELMDDMEVGCVIVPVTKGGIVGSKVGLQLVVLVIYVGIVVAAGTEVVVFAGSDCGSE